jgi:hypothetical protein
MGLKQVYKRIFYRWWAVNRATFSEPQANWQPSLDFTLWGESGQEILSIYDRAGPFQTRQQAEEVCARMNLAALEGRTSPVEPPAASGGVPIAPPATVG